jgi:predicted peptidase
MHSKGFFAFPSCILMALALLLAGCGHIDMDAANARAPSGTGFSIQRITVDGETRNYGLFVPHHYKAGTPTPAIVFLHGVLQAGSDGRSQMGQGLGPNIARNPERFPCLAIFPQSSGDWTGEARDRLAMAVLDEVCRRYTVDPERIVLTGLSNGGYGTWHIGANHVDRFAALVPVSGGSDYDAVSKLAAAHIPIWCFHNGGDFIIFSSNTREMNSRLKAAGANVKYTEFDAVGHECWDQVYGDEQVIGWMLAQRRGARAAVAHSDAK